MCVLHSLNTATLRCTVLRIYSRFSHGLIPNLAVWRDFRTPNPSFFRTNLYSPVHKTPFTAGDAAGTRPSLSGITIATSGDNPYVYPYVDFSGYLKRTSGRQQLLLKDHLHRDYPRRLDLYLGTTRHTCDKNSQLKFPQFETNSTIIL